MPRRVLSWGIISGSVAAVVVACDGQATGTGRHAGEGGAARDGGATGGVGGNGSGGRTSSGGAGAGGGPSQETLDATATLPACVWPARLDPNDAAPRGTCRAARMFLTCDIPGATEICISNDPTRCPALSFVPGATVCRDQCRANEYGAMCGVVGSGPSPDPDLPATCRVALQTPGGLVFYCCPCL